MNLYWFLSIPFGLIALVTVAELFSRCWLRWRGNYFVWAPGVRRRLHIDRNVLPNLEPIVYWEINKDGERGGIPPRSNKKTYRILTAGGSPTEGYFLDQPSSWPGALERLLQRQEILKTLGVEGVHVGNIGRSRVGSEELNLIFEKVLPRYQHLDVVVIMVGGTDIIKWLESGAPVNWSPPPVAARHIFDCHPEGPFGWIPRRLALTEIIRRIRRQLLRPLEVKEKVGKTLGKLRQKRARAKEIRNEVPDPTVMLDRYEYYLRKVINKTQKYADRVIIACQPCFDKDHTPKEIALFWNFGVGNAYTDDVTIYYSLKLVGRLMALLNERAVQVAKSLGVEHVDLMPILEKSSRTYYDFLHFTPEGAEVVAKAIATKILQKPIHKK